MHSSRPSRGLSAKGYVCLWGVYPRGVCPWECLPTAYWDTHPPLPIACWYPPSPRTEGITLACKNITLPQTSFAGSNNGIP